MPSAAAEERGERSARQLAFHLEAMLLSRLPATSVLAGNLASLRAATLRDTATMSASDSNPYGMKWHRSMLRCKVCVLCKHMIVRIGHSSVSETPDGTGIVYNDFTHDDIGQLPASVTREKVLCNDPPVQMDPLVKGLFSFVCMSFSLASAPGLVYSAK